MSQEKEALQKFYKTREDKEIEKVIALENKFKVLDDIVYKTSQLVQTMNMLNRDCKTSFVKLEFLNKTQRANPLLYDIGCYNDNLDLMLAPESDETIRLAQECRSKLSDLIKPFDYKNLNNLYDLFVPQHEKEYCLYTRLDEVTNLQCDYLETLEKCEHLEKELSKTTENVNNKSFNELSKRFSELEQHSINLELALQQMKFGNDQIAPILGYGDMVQGNITIRRVYYVKGLNHNLFSGGQFCDADLEVAFQKSTCYICDLKENDLLKGSHGTYLNFITLQDIPTPNLI
ncbi:hypothetical protein Tco_0096746 [Tanacetum coccineum]